MLTSQIRRKSLTLITDINVEPDVVASADVGQLGQRIVGAEDGGTASCIEEKWSPAVVDALADAALEHFRSHPTGLVGCHRDHLIGSEAGPVRCLGD